MLVSVAEIHFTTSFEIIFMTIAISSPVTGTAQTGLTSPTYTVESDTPPAGVRGKQYAVSALGGTQTGVEANRVGQPFTLSYIGPATLRGAPTVSQSTGAPTSYPRNVHKFIGRKGVEVVTGYYANANYTLEISVPAGAEVKDAESVRAGLSAMIGALSQISSGLGDTLISGTI